MRPNALCVRRQHHLVRPHCVQHRLCLLCDTGCIIIIRPKSVYGRQGLAGSRSVLKIHFFIESGLKMIQFKIQFKTKSKIFIQKNIHSIESRIFNRIIHSKKIRKIIQNSQMRPRYVFGALLRPQYR